MRLCNYIESLMRDGVAFINMQIISYTELFNKPYYRKMVWLMCIIIPSLSTFMLVLKGYGLLMHTK